MKSNSAILMAAIEAQPLVDAVNFPINDTAMDIAEEKLDLLLRPFNSADRQAINELAMSRELNDMLSLAGKFRRQDEQAQAKIIKEETEAFKNSPSGKEMLELLLKGGE